MRRYLLPVATFSSIVGIGLGAFAEPPPAKPPSANVSLGTSAQAGKAAPAASAGASVSGAATPGAATPATPRTTPPSPPNVKAQGDAVRPGDAIRPDAVRQGDAVRSKDNALSSPLVAKGHAAYLSRDFNGAMQAYKEATGKDGSDPANYYFLGEAQVAAGVMTEADASFASGLKVVGNKDDLHGKLLFVVADLRERQGKWADAKKAWEEYAQFLATHPNVKGYAATATERVKTVDTRTDLEAKYASVRQRIEDRNKENANVSPAPDAPSTPPSSAPKKK